MNSEWYNENEQRAYPLAENASGVSDAGSSLPTDIIVDLSVSVPRIYTALYISSLRITPDLVSLVVSGLNGATRTGLLVGTYARTGLNTYKAYALTPAVPYVGGWVAFGNHVTSAAEDYRFSSAAQSGLESRAVRPVDAPGITKFLRHGGTADQAAEGLVEWLGEGGLVISTGIYNSPAVPSLDGLPVLLFGLRSDIAGSLVGPCSAEASSETCVHPPLRSINGVKANAEGKLAISFQ